MAAAVWALLKREMLIMRAGDWRIAIGILDEVYHKTSRARDDRSKLDENARVAIDKDELPKIMTQLRNGHDVLPFMTSLLPADSVSLRLLPNEMRAVLERSADYQSPAPGTGPVWLQLSGQSDNEVATLIIYRSLGDGCLYVMAPDPA